MFNKSFLAFALLHISVPAISIAFWDANPLWLIGGLIFAAATIRTLHEKGSASVTSFLCVLSGAAFFLTLMLGTSYYMTGEGFNDSFFYHLNSGSMVIAARSYGNVFYPSLLGLLLAFLAPAIIYKTQSYSVWPAVPLMLLWLLAVVGNYPIHSLISYQTGLGAVPDMSIPLAEKPSPGIAPEQVIAVETPPDPRIERAPETGIEPEFEPEPGLEPEPEPEPGLESGLEPGLKKNIVLIYAESLEELYFETEIFGDLLPNIRALSGKAHRFTNLFQVGGTGWTIAGIVASQCGFPLKVSNPIASNSTMASVDKPFENETCLADILSDNGYETVFMGGAPLWFAGKGNFLSTHGYQRISGDEQLAPLLPDRSYQSGWGLHDDSLFELALDELRSLENKTQPYLLTLLTLDTHHPNGLPSKSCKKLADNRDAMSNAIYCSDQLISQFISEAMKIADMKDTIIVLFSDHLSLRNTLWSILKDNKKRRRLAFMIFDDSAATASNIRGTHFDVAPTMLEAAGFADYPKIGAGISLFTQSPSQRGGGQSAKNNVSAPSLLGETASIRDDGIALSRRDLTLKIGDLTLKANSYGQEFVSGMYMAVFNEKGVVVDAVFSENFAVLAQKLNGKFVAGVSVQRAPPYSAVYFYGRLSPDGRGMTQREFNYDIHLKANDIWPLQDDR